MAPYIYKILALNIWKEAEAAGIFKGAGIDLNDGFIHFSLAEQVAGTGNLFFKDNTEELVVLQVDAAKVDQAKLKYESGFPHLYDSLDTKLVEKVVPFTKVDGVYTFKEE